MWMAAGTSVLVAGAPAVVVAAGADWVVAPVPVLPPPSSPEGSAASPPAMSAGAEPGAKWRLDPKLDLAFDAVAGSWGHLDPSLATSPEGAGLVLRRARLGLAAAVDDWEVRLDQELAAPSPVVVSDPLFPLGPSAAAPRATEAYLAYAPSAAWRMTAGSQRVPLSWARLMDPADQWLGAAPLPVSRLLPDYRVGLSMSGDLGLIQYHLGWFAPQAGSVARCNREGSLWVFRLGGEPIGPVGQVPWRRLSRDPWYPWWRFSHAISLAWADLPDLSTHLLLVTGEQSFSWRRFTLMAEILWQRRSPTLAGAVAADSLAVWVDTGVFVVRDRLALIARFDWFNGLLGTREATDTFGLAAGAEVSLAPDPAKGPRVFLRITGDRRWQRFGPDAREGVRLSLVFAR